MSHPFQSYREDKVERSRVTKLIGAAGVSAGGSGVTNDKTSIKGKSPAAAMKVEGRASGGRLDKYARGGAVKKGSTNVNVIIAPQGGGGVPSPAAPPLAGGPPVPPQGGPPPPMMPPGPMPQRDGGRTRYAAGGKVGNGGAWAEGLRNGTQVQHADGKNDGADIYRGRQVTFATGGPVEANKMGPRMRGGAEGARARLEKIGIQKRSKAP